VIAGSDPGSWIIGAPAVLFASWVSLRLRAAAVGPDRNGMRLGGLLRFAPFFAIESIRGGLDVAQRVMRPQLRINPGFQSYRPRLSDPIARVVFLDSISLLPGTLSADMREGVIQVHALDARSDLAPELARLERRIADLFGEQLQPAPE
jgi:multicomponent Na+:H+ antiporter subunit E